MKEQLPKEKHYWPYTLILGFIVIVPIFLILFNKFIDWSKDYEIHKQKMIALDLNKPYDVVKREEIVSKPLVLDYPEDIDTPLEKYICDKFGTYDCKTALAVAKAESGLREDAFNINTNNTIDVGIFQINSIHFSKPGCSLQEIVFANNNVDCAFLIWQASGWGAWTAWNSGAHLAKME